MPIVAVVTATLRCMFSEGEGAWGDELLMHGAPLVLVPWGLRRVLCSLLLIIKGLCHFLMYAWDQISLFRTYTPLHTI